MTMEKLKISIDFYQKVWYYIIKEREMTRHTRQGRINGSPEPNSPKGRSFRWVAELEENGSPHNSAIFEGSYSDGLTVEKILRKQKGSESDGIE